MLEKQSTTDYSSPNFTLLSVDEVLKSESNYFMVSQIHVQLVGAIKRSILVSGLILDAEAEA